MSDKPNNPPLTATGKRTASKAVSGTGSNQGISEPAITAAAVSAAPTQNQTTTQTSKPNLDSPHSHQAGHSASESPGKHQFVAELYRQQALPLVKFLAARYRNPAEAQDIAQEAWLRIFRLQHPEQLDNARAFLFQTAANLAIDRARRGKLEQRYLDLELGLAEPPLAPSMEQTLAGREALEQVELVLAKLPLKCRQAFVLHRSRGLPYPEIAQQLGVSTSMVEKYIIQALKALRQAISH